MVRVVCRQNTVARSVSMEFTVQEYIFNLGSKSTLNADWGGRFEHFTAVLLIIPVRINVICQPEHGFHIKRTYQMDLVEVNCFKIQYLLSL